MFAGSKIGAKHVPSLQPALDFVVLLSLRVYSASIAEAELSSLRLIIFTFKPHLQYMNITAQDLEQ